mgnify:CR=1 FL=1
MATQIPVTIDRTSPVPLYHQLAQQLTGETGTQVLAATDGMKIDLDKYLP